MKAITEKVCGIKCDAPGCNYQDMTARLENYELYLDKPCPLCGGNLLTKKDYAATKAILAMTNYINEMIGEQPDLPDVKAKRIRIDMRGDGSITPIEVE